MRVIAALLALILVFLAIMVVTTDAGQRLLGDRAGSSTSSAAAVGSQLQASLNSDGSHSCLNEATLRRIIREELAALPATTATLQTAEEGNAAGSTHDPDGALQLELVNEQLDGYIRAGAISDTEMAALQGEIAKLDKATRHEVLGRLVRAINSGSLKGQL